jgi:hypothetical protein
MGRVGERQEASGGTPVRRRAQGPHGGRAIRRDARNRSLVALARARHERSLDGVLHAAPGFAGLGEREVAAERLAIAARLAVTADERARLQEVATAI